MRSPSPEDDPQRGTGVRSRGSAGSRDGPPPSASRVGAEQALSLLLRLELEDVLHSVFAARQDVLDLRDRPDQSGVWRSADSTLLGCAATIQLLLRLLRTTAEEDGGSDELLELMSGAFGVLRDNADVVYFNSALRTLIGTDQRSLALSTFEERTWIDRDVMAQHLTDAKNHGAARTRTVLTRGDGTVVPIVVSTRTIEDHPEVLLLVGLREVPADEDEA